MKARIKFSKHGNMVYIGHLDMLRYFQKAVRRAGIPIRYSGGYSPHQVMSFAAPLGVGLESNAEYIDIELEADDSFNFDTAREALDLQMAEGVRVLSFRMLPDDCKAAMALVDSADYSVSICAAESGGPVPDTKQLKEAASQLMDSTELKLTVTDKKGAEKEKDIRPMIRRLDCRDGRVFLHLSQGSAANLKPGPVLGLMNACLREHGYPEFRAVSVIREETYDAAGDPL